MYLHTVKKASTEFSVEAFFMPFKNRVMLKLELYLKFWLICVLFFLYCPLELSLKIK